METITDYQRHLVEQHEFAADDDALKPWCEHCLQPLQATCPETGEKCVPAIEDLEALHTDVHGDEDYAPKHQH